MAYEYITRSYGKNYVIAQRVRHTVTGEVGSVAREDKSAGHYVQVKFEGRKFSVPCHPDELEQCTSL